MKKPFSFTCFIIVLSICVFSPLYVDGADKERGQSKGQLVYVPAYSHIYSGDRERPFLLTVTLSVRNIDPKNQIKIISVDYYETQGKLLKKYVEKPIVLNPLGTSRYVVPQKDKSGGSGANFLVEWQSDAYVNPPIIESIMISTQMQRGISFTSRGQEILIPKR
jgi:Protein of unknown function (DUF3124)